MDKNKFQIKSIALKCRKCANKIIFAISVLLILSSIIYLTKAVFNSINDAQIIFKLKEQVATQVVDMDSFKKINKEVEWKKQPLAEDEKMTRNPFE